MVWFPFYQAICLGFFGGLTARIVRLSFRLGFPRSILWLLLTQSKASLDAAGHDGCPYPADGGNFLLLLCEKMKDA
jgi:hypothetical protein